MIWWSHLSALGGLNLTALLALATGAWLAGARSWRLALVWCGLLCGAMALAAATQMAFIGWGLGIRALSFTGFSGHATRAAAVYPVALYVLGECCAPRKRVWARAIALGGALAGVLLGLGVALARVKVGAHSPSEAVTGCLLGLAAAGLFIAQARAAREASPRPPQVGLRLGVLAGALAAVILLPRADSPDPHQWLTAAALKLSGRDRAWLREDWAPAQGAYLPPCDPGRVRFTFLCT